VNANAFGDDTTSEYGICELCGRWSVVGIRSIGGYFVYRSPRSIHPVWLCVDCGLAALNHAPVEVPAWAGHRMHRGDSAAIYLG